MSEKVCTLAFANKAAEAIESYGDDTQCYLTVGLSYRNPRTHDKPMKSGELADYIREHGKSYWWDITEDGGELHVSAYSDGDMF